MLKAIGWMLKAGFFALVILILGNVIRWEGKTISDQIKTQVSQAEQWPLTDHVRDFAGKLTRDSRLGIGNYFRIGNSGSSEGSMSEDISPSERQKLKALIRELNSPHVRD